MTRCRVVIVDDSADIRLLLQLAVQASPGMEVVGEAENGAEAVSLAHLLQPEMMLLDLAMPVMDGLEALPLIRDLSPSTAIVVVSGFLTDAAKQSVLDAGAVGFVEKGGDFAELARRVQALWADHLGE